MSANAYSHSVATPRRSPVCRWSGVAAGPEAARDESSLMREISWIAMLGPEAPPIPKILRTDFDEAATHPGPPAGMVCNSISWEIDEAFSRQLEKFAYPDCFADPIDAQTATAACDAIVESDPIVASQLDDGTSFSAYVRDRSDKESRPLGTWKSPYGVRLTAEISAVNPVLGRSGKTNWGGCHPATLTALCAVMMCHRLHDGWDHYGYPYNATIAAPESATLRAAKQMSRASGEWGKAVEAAYALLETRGLGKLADALRRRPT